MTSPSKAVDLVVNVFERNYRHVFREGFFFEIEAQNRRAFARRVALINNVDDLPEAKALAQPLLNSGELTRLVVVAGALPEAVRRTGWKPRDFGRIPHYSDCALVAVTLEGSPWLLYWDADISLEQPTDWLGPAIDFLDANPEGLVANPDWGGAHSESLRTSGDFCVGYGFSDQIFLARPEELAQPIYHYLCPASWRYPMAHISLIFEARIDAFMRRRRRLRATFMPARYQHPAHRPEYPSPRGLVERLRRWRNRWVLRLLRLKLWSSPSWRIE